MSGTNHKKKEAAIAVIGGSGLYALEQLRDVRELRIKTPFGAPSDAIVLGTLRGVKAAFLPRHGRGHTLLPGEINQRANMWALKSLGVRAVLSVSAVGSLKEKLKPTHFVFPDQFVDQTKGRPSTFFGGGIVGHVPLAQPFCAGLSELLYKEAVKLGIKSHLGGTYVCMEGPAFSTRAESRANRRMGYDVIGMTVATEAKLAREAGFHYVPVSLVTDYDCWKEGEEVSKDLVLRNLFTNVDNARRLLERVIPLVSEGACRGHCASFVSGSVLTAKKNFPAAAHARIRMLIG